MSHASAAFTSWGERVPRSVPFGTSRRIRPFWFSLVPRSLGVYGWQLLSALHVGFWTLKIYKNDNHHELAANDTMKDILGFAADASPKEQYTEWVLGIDPACCGSVHQAIEKMTHENRVVQFNFRWAAASKPYISLRFSGILMEDDASYVKLKGCCRLLTEDSNS